MGYFWFWIFWFFLIVAIFAWPTWPYTRQRRVYRRGRPWHYGPSGGAALVAVLILLFFWFGLIAVWTPWYYYPVAA